MLLRGVGYRVRNTCRQTARTGGGSRFRLPAGRYAEAPAAALVPPLAWREFPKSASRRRYADFSDTLHCSIETRLPAGCPIVPDGAGGHAIGLANDSPIYLTKRRKSVSLIRRPG